MKNIQKLITLCAILVLSACATSKDPRELTLEAGSNKAIVLMKVNKARIPYHLNITPFDKETKKRDKKFQGSAGLRVNPDLGVDYIARVVDPGSYVFEFVEQQMLWAVCFNKNSFTFDINAGEILYLGDFNSRIHLAQLQALVVQNGNRTSVNNDKFSYFDDILPPQFAKDPQEDAEGLAAAKLFVETNMVNVVGEVKAAKYEKTHFLTGGGSLLGEMFCTLPDYKPEA